MAKKSTKYEEYREILAKGGIRFEDCLVLAFVFEHEKGPEKFHLWLMLDQRRPKYHLFDCFDKIAQVIVPKEEAITEIICDIANRAGGKRTTPNLI